jgi:hypothetical protein
LQHVARWGMHGSRKSLPGSTEVASGMLMTIGGVS